MGATAIATGLLLATAPAFGQRSGGQVVPGNVGAGSENTSSSGVRGQCADPEAGELPLTALLPQTAIAERSGQTTAAYPTLWFYLPETTAEMANFWLIDEQGDLVYDLMLELQGQVGLIALPLDRMEDMPALEVGQRYEWTFALVCDPLDRGGDVLVSGELERIELPPEQATRLDSLTEPQQRALAYAELGLWHDMLTPLAQLYREQPSDGDLAGLWEQMLDDAGLSALDRADFAAWEL